MHLRSTYIKPHIPMLITNRQDTYSAPGRCFLQMVKNNNLFKIITKIIIYSNLLSTPQNSNPDICFKQLHVHMKQN